LASWFENGPRGASAADMAAQLALISRSDKDDGGNQVGMMTLHASKGLEFPYVFIVGCEDGVLPHQVSLDEGNLQECRAGRLPAAPCAGSDPGAGRCCRPH
ncbi:hypothetical protein K9F17_20145, partial [Stenotrophomonas acidaminiphila]|nr:hypothetical protein [Stenotrophomonas acidaminiphila]